MGTMDSHGFKRYVYAIENKGITPLTRRVSFPEEQPLSPEKILSEILTDLTILSKTNNDYETKKWMAKMLPLIDLLKDLKETFRCSTPESRKLWVKKAIQDIEQQSLDKACQPANPALKTLINKVKAHDRSS